MFAQPTEPVRIATFAAPLSRDGPGLLLRDLVANEDPQIGATIAIVNRVNPDVLLLTDFDYDASGVGMAAFSDGLRVPYEYQYSARPNAGVQTGLDVDGNGYTGDARDALGYGRFLGDGGMALFSRYPILTKDITDLTYLLWRAVPERELPTLNGTSFPSETVLDVLPVSSSGHWVVPIDINGAVITLFAYSATAPVFDGPEDFNGLRNRDELRVWEAVLNGSLQVDFSSPVLIGNVNADPFDGEGIRAGIANVLAHPSLQDPMPESDGAAIAADGGHVGNPAFDTADWSVDGPGNLRVSYVLPSRELTITGAGVFWPAPDDQAAELLGSDGLAAGPHHLVWVDVHLDGSP
ncbi:MAG TPA: endonuclease [Octadecabacter sp.]|nr:endonuclease [Octadecabacter sp.]